MTAGTRIEVQGWDMQFQPTWEAAQVARWTKAMGGRDALPGYHPVRFNDGGVLMVHESRFRVVDNRA